MRSLWARYRCPVCNSRVNAFERLPEFYLENQEKYGFPYRPEEAETCNHRGYLCPYCQASDRERLYALYLRNYLGSLNSSDVISIVDFAPSAPLSDFIRRQIKASESTVSYRTADYSGQGVDDKVDITNLEKYAEGQFDFFICSHVLEHVTDDGKALRELYRVLQRGGKGILMVPIILSLKQIDEDPTISDERERWRRFGQDDHVRIYSKRGFIERVEDSGFQVHQYGKEFFGEKLFIRAGITSQSVLYVVEK
jgi:SAM-dependent methyltransferase